MELTGIPYLHPPPAPVLPMHRDRDFIAASEWLARAPADPAALVIGAPFAGGSISRARCDLTPGAVRAALARSSVWSSDWAVSLDGFAVLDAGDIEPADGVEETQERIAETIFVLRERADVPVVLIGGDNSVTVGGARGTDASGLMTFDAHHDCRDPATGVTNGSPVRQLVEHGLERVVQIGIHGFSNAEANARWAVDHKIHIITAARVREQGMAQTIKGADRWLGSTDTVWADFDLDVLDRAHAPGAPAAGPGGLHPGDLQQAAYMLGQDPRVAGMDLTEIDPEADIAEITVRAAAAIMLSYLAGVASR